MILTIHHKNVILVVSLVAANIFLPRKLPVDAPYASFVVFNSNVIYIEAVNSVDSPEMGDRYVVLFGVVAVSTLLSAFFILAVLNYSTTYKTTKELPMKPTTRNTQPQETPINHNIQRYLATANPDIVEGLRVVSANPGFCTFFIDQLRQFDGDNIDTILKEIEIMGELI